LINYSTTKTFTMNIALPPIFGTIASPQQAQVQARTAALGIRRLALSTAVPGVLALDANGMIDVGATTVAANHHNQLATTLARDTGVHQVGATLADLTDAAVNAAADQFMGIVDASNWKWYCPNGRDHATRSVGAHAVRCFRSVIRFGALVYKELYDLCGRTYGEKNCHKAIQRLIAEDFLIRLPKLGRKMLFGLHRRISDEIPSAGRRAYRDEVALAAARSAGRQVVAARRN
jgi:hypothetical protein